MYFECFCMMSKSAGLLLTAWVSGEDKLDAPKQNACRLFVSLESWNQGLSMIEAKTRQRQCKSNCRSHASSCLSDGVLPSNIGDGKDRAFLRTGMQTCLRSFHLRS